MFPGRINWIIQLTLLGCLLVLGIEHSANAAVAQEYNVGVGIADITGPAAEIGMMGYASATQSARGIHIRLYSRAFAFDSGEANGLVVFVSVDCAMIGSAIKLEVVRELQVKFGSKYTKKNVMLSATHTHSGPAGYMQYALYGISSYGFVQANFRAIVDGIVESIEKADKNMQPGYVYLNKGRVEGANINRSPSSYEANPLEERLQYGSGTSAEDYVDKDMVMLRIDAKDGTKLGMVNWFAVHPTSMNNTNQLVSGDNKGYASQLFEKEMNPNDRMGTGKFVAAFASSNLGDVSPNIKGPKCIDTGLECDYNHSTCNNLTQNCIAFGPGDNMKASTRIIATRQYETARQIYDDETTRVNVHGSVKYSHQYINMTNYQVTIQENGQTKTVTTCPGALGFSFAAGTTDGPGAFDFTQGDTNGNPFWSLIRDMLRAPSQQQLACQHPKPILLDVGETHFPYDWVPSIVETQVFKIGNVYLIGFPGELTTMSGRRMRNAVKAIADGVGGDMDNIAIVAGLSNVYTHYVATFEEYQMQRYEAASTLYGPHTLSAYIQQYSLLTRALLTNSAVEEGPNPPLLIKGQISFNPPIVMDMPPFLRKMGECIREPYPRAYPGEAIKVTFIAGHPRNNPLRGGSFFLVERKPVGGDKYAKWETVATDADWNTEFRWVRPVPLLPNSEIDFTWEIPENTPEGTYRIRHFGYYKPLLRDPLPYTGSTIEFQVRGVTTVPSFLYRRPAPPVKKQKIRTIGDFWNALSGNSGSERDLKADQHQSVFGSSAFMR